MRYHLIVAVVWLVLTAIGEFVAQKFLDILPVVASQQGLVIDHAFATLLRLTVPVFTFVVSILLAVIFLRDGSAQTGSAPHDHRLFSWSWVVVTALLNIYFIIGPGVNGINEIVFGNPNYDLLVQVHAKQWGWTFEYPQYHLQESELVLPVGKRIRFELTSSDVIHSFWIPAFRLKLDAVPGQTNVEYVNPTRVISSKDDLMVRVQCAELCGLGHSDMRAAVEVLSQADFQKWVEKEQKSHQGS